MKAADVVRRMQEHRMWVNQRLLAAAEKLSPEQLEQVCAIGQGTIWKSLVHMWAAEYVWLAALHGEEAKAPMARPRCLPPAMCPSWTARATPSA